MASLQQKLIAFFRAKSWQESQRLVEQHPELLQPETDVAMQWLADSVTDEETLRIVEEHQAVLARCREVGIEQAFGEKMRPPVPENGLQIPPGLEAEVAEAQRLLEAHRRRDWRVLEPLIQLYEQMLGRLGTDEYPAFRAAVEHNLGAAYVDLPTGDKQANLERAIACYQAALRFRTEENAPFDYASTLNNLAYAYQELPNGDKESLMAQAKACYEKALEFWTLEEAPRGYATIQLNLGNLYQELPTGDHGANLAQAIAYYKEALRVWTPETEPINYATTQNSLGNAYQELPTGDKGANLARAIRCYQEALRFRTEQATSFDYATTQSNLGAAYISLPTSNREENLTQAIQCLREALRFLTPQASPLDYAATQNNLGNAYYKLPTGDRTANLTQAIQCYQEALRFRTLLAVPHHYAVTQDNLANAYADLLTGNREGNLKRAIDCYTEALKVWTPVSAPQAYATTQHNLGNAYVKLPIGDKGEHLTQAIRCYEEALRFDTAESAPFRYAETQNNLGAAYSLLPSGHKKENLARSITHFQEVLRIQTPETTPHECRRTNRNLARLYFTQKNWPAALDAYHAAMDAGERLYRAGLSPDSKATEVAQNALLYHHAAFAAARLGNTTEALLILERGKTRLLTEALRLRVPRPTAVPDKVWAAFEEASAVVRRVQSKGTTLTRQEREKDPVQAYEARQEAARAANAALDAAVTQVREYAPHFLSEVDLSAIRALLPDKESALIAFCITTQGSYGFILSHHLRAVQVVDVPHFTTDSLRTLLQGPNESSPWGGWIGAYQAQHETAWHSTIEQVLAEVGQKLLSSILSRLPPKIKRLIFLPSGGLFLLPLHAAPLSVGGRVCDRYQVSYAPSAEVLADLQAKATRESGNQLYAVINPEEDPALPFTPAEEIALASLFPEHEIHKKRAGTKEAVEGGVRGRAYLHFSCHGTYNWHSPPESGLALADGHLTLAELQSGKVDMSAARLVTLSACETGMTDIIKGSPEEYVGLPAGFMLAGVSCVVASLWAVRDISTALLMERFYRNHLEGGMDFVEALHEAQKWVRELLIGEVADYAETCFRQAKRKDRAPLLIHKNHYHHRAQQNPNERPFAHPYYWAAFTVNGM